MLRSEKWESKAWQKQTNNENNKLFVDGTLHHTRNVKMKFIQRKTGPIHKNWSKYGRAHPCDATGHYRELTTKILSLPEQCQRNFDFEWISIFSVSNHPWCRLAPLIWKINFILLPATFCLFSAMPSQNIIRKLAILIWQKVSESKWKHRTNGADRDVWMQNCVFWRARHAAHEKINQN